MKHHFEITSVDEANRDKISFQPSEIVPLINITNEIPSSLPLVPDFRTINETSKTTTRSSNSSKQSLKRNSSVTNLDENFHSSSASINCLSPTTNTNADGKMDEFESYYSTVDSAILDPNTLWSTNKFLYELRLKRREIRDKTKNLSIEQRIALNRPFKDQSRVRAQDIFDVNFAISDDDDVKHDIFNEDLQEKIRNNIFNELDRQRMKQYKKQQRQLIYGRTLLVVFVSLFAIMGITLVYVVMNLYDRAKYLDIKLSDEEFLPIPYDTTTNI